MSFVTSPAKSFKFKPVPDATKQSKQAFALGFAKAVVSSPISAQEKVAWLKYSNQLPPGGPPHGGAPGGAPGDDAGVEPVAGPGPGFLPEGAGEDQAIQQLLEALPGDSVEEKLHSAVVALLEAQNAGGDAGDDGSGIEDDGTGVEDGQLDPAIIQQLMAQQGPGPQPPKGPPQGQGAPQPPPGGPPKGPPGK